MISTTKRTQVFQSLSLGLVVLAATASTSLAAYHEDFNSITDGVTLGTVPGWTPDAGSSSSDIWHVASTAGQTGNGIKETSGSGTATYDRALSTAEDVQIGDGAASFSIDFRLGQTENRYFDMYVVLTEAIPGNFAQNAIGVRLHGGGSFAAGDSRNLFIQGTNGTGTGSLGSMGISTVNDSGGNAVHWAVNTWYTMTITGINVQATGAGSDTTGLLSVFETSNPSNVLISNYTITGDGPTAFTQINGVALRETSSSPRGMQFDNLSLTTAVPEPASAGLLLYAGAGMLLRRRRAVHSSLD